MLPNKLILPFGLDTGMLPYHRKHRAADAICLRLEDSIGATIIGLLRSASNFLRDRSLGTNTIFLTGVVNKLSSVLEVDIDQDQCDENMISRKDWVGLVTSP